MTKGQVRNKAEEHWALWRLVLSDGGFDYNTVFHQMTPAQVDEANAALDIMIEHSRKKSKG